MPAYIIVQVDVRDPVAYERYKALAESSVSAHGGKYIVRGGATETLEGSWKPPRLVVLEFPSAVAARAWWASPEYAEGKALRQAVAGSQMLLAEGVAGDPR
ncbi:MAG TPA: DUF1330 domain-containing protein [Longimicrobiales bacterium]|nr:DUF1330 domain-containing protein [Longimicrobiales bacterium]